MKKINKKALQPLTDKFPLSLFGYSITTKAIAKRFKNSKFFDDKFLKKSRDENRNLLLPPKKFKAKKSKLEIVTPGIPPTHKMVKKAKNLISDYDLFSSIMPYSIWISGTNGKTTTTQMLYHLLKEKSAVMGGNIGIPVASLNPKAKIWILETSSFTLHYTKIAKPNIYILLPIKPDHLSWHGDFKSYEKAKLKPLKSMNEGEIVILPKKYKDVKTSAFKIIYENSQDLAKSFEINLKKIKLKEPFLLDGVLALAVSKILFDKIDYQKINSFVIDSHKIEEFKDKKKRTWVDDSKATNLDATIEAVRRYRKKKIYLILGGDDKGVDLSPLFETLKNYNVEIFCIGKNAQKLFKLSQEIDKKAILSQTLENAVKNIDIKLNKKSIALLSPSAASFDQFNSYKDRGEKFKNFVNSLKG